MLALSHADELASITGMASRDSLPWDVFVPATLADAEEYLLAGSVGIIITDFSFSGGEFAEWLSLWQYQFVLLLDFPELGKFRKFGLDEYSAFVMRDDEGKYLSVLPLVIERSLNVFQSRDSQNRYLSMTERRYMELLRTIPDIVYILDADGRFEYVNDAVAALGWTESLLKGRHFSEIINPEDAKRVSRANAVKSKDVPPGKDCPPPPLFDERRTGGRITRNLEIRLARWYGGNPESPDPDDDSGDIWGEVSSSGFFGAQEGSGLGTIGIIRDITQRKRDAAIVAESLRMKESLLKEIHHRVKNNLQVVSSLLNLRLGTVDSEETREALTICQNQIHSIAIVHEQLYRSSDYSGIAARPYLEKLLDSLSSYGGSGGFALSVHADDSVLQIDQAIPVGLIATELVTNSFRHAPTGDAGCSCAIHFGFQDGVFSLKVADSGKGYPESILEGGHNVGLELVRALTLQLKGTLSLSNSRGAVAEIAFPVPVGLASGPSR